MEKKVLTYRGVTYTKRLEYKGGNFWGRKLMEALQVTGIVSLSSVSAQTPHLGRN